jgi:hypothetical protein
VSESLSLVKQLLSYLRIFLSAFFRSQTGTHDRSESPGFDSGCRWTASPLRSSRGLIPSLRDNHRKQKQNGPRLLKVGAPARHLELENSSLARARDPAVVLNGCPKISLPWGFSGRQPTVDSGSTGYGLRYTVQIHSTPNPSIRFLFITGMFRWPRSLLPSRTITKIEVRQSSSFEGPAHP